MNNIRSLRLKLHNDRRPITPIRDWRVWLLAIPSILSSVGFCCFAILALAFTEIRGLPWWVRTGLIIVGGIAVAVGGEVGTPAVVLEVFRKICGGWYPEQSGIRRGIMIMTDISSTIISLFATLAQFLVAFAALLVVAAQTTQWVTSVNAVWAPYTEIWGPIAIGLLAALDAYGGFSELGMYLGDHDQRMTRWVNELERLEVEMNHSGPAIQERWQERWDDIELYRQRPDVFAGLVPDDAVLDTDRYRFSTGLHPAVSKAVESDDADC